MTTKPDYARRADGKLPHLALRDFQYVVAHNGGHRPSGLTCALCLAYSKPDGTCRRGRPGSKGWPKVPTGGWCKTFEVFLQKTPKEVERDQLGL